MWIYLTGFALTYYTYWCYKNTIKPFEPFTKGWFYGKEIVKEINKRGLSICVKWTKDIITYKLSQYLVEIHHKHYIVKYPYGLEMYKIKIPRKRGPRTFSKISDGIDDVTREVLKYMGPSHNFHSIETTPKMLGYSKLVFIDEDEQDIISFIENEIIDVNKII